MIPLPPTAAGAVLARFAFDYTDLEAAMAEADNVIRETRCSLDRFRNAG